MKRTLCFLFSVLLLFSSFAIFAGAEVTATSDVMTDLAQLEIDGQPFNDLKESQYPVNTSDTTLHVITVVEKGFRSNQSGMGYELYFYIYNPSCQVVKSDKFNSIQLATDEYATVQNYYAVQIQSVSEDNRFLKIRLVDNDIYSSSTYIWRNQTDINKRLYNILSLRMRIGSSLSTFAVNRAFYFEGFDYNNTIKCSWKDMEACTVELHTTNWISPNAGLRVDNRQQASIYDHYELHTVYFRVDKEYWEKYGNLWGVRATYDKVHLTPIIVTHKNDIDFSNDEGQFTKEAILKGTSLSGSSSINGDFDVYDLVWYNRLSWVDGSAYNAHAYSEKKTLIDLDFIPFLPMVKPYRAEYHDSLAYYFATLPDSFDYKDGDSLVSAAVPQDVLKAYFYERYVSYGKNSNLYTEYISNQDLSLEATMFEAESLYSMTDYSTILNSKAKWRQWMVDWMTEDDTGLYETFADSVNHIQVITNPGSYINVSDPESVANELFIHKEDMDEFSKVCLNAMVEDDYVVLLRIGFNDYSCTPVRDAWEANVDQGPYVAVAVDKWIYLNINVAELVFNKDGAKHSVPVVSSTVDSVGNIDASGDKLNNGVSEYGKEVYNKVSDLLDETKDFFLIVGLIVLVVAVLMVISSFKGKKENISINFFDVNNGSKKRRNRKRK